MLAVPLLEISLTSFARVISGKPVMQGSPDHVAKRMQKMGFSLVQTVIACYALTVVLVLAGIAVMLGNFKTALTVTLASFSALLVLALILLSVKVDKK
jgi:hypothetical protein